MHILTEDNDDNTYKYTVIQLPEKFEALVNVGIHEKVAKRATGYEQFTAGLIDQLPFAPLQGFLQDCLHYKKVCYVHLFEAYDVPEGTEGKTYLCFGNYHREVGVDEKRFFSVLIRSGQRRISRNG